MEFRLKIPKDFADYAREIASKGWIEVPLEVSGSEHQLCFYDPIRLLQDVEAERESGGVFHVRNLIVVDQVDLAHMEDAVNKLAKTDFTELD